MIPVLYPSTETLFTTNGLGGLPDAISCVVTEQRNTQGGYYLEMDYPIDGLHYADIAPDRIIYAAPSMGNTPQPFRISRITRPINGIVHIEAQHVSAELQKIVTYGRMRAYTVWGLWSDFKGVATNIGQTCPFTISSNFNLTEAINFWFDEPITMASLLMGMEGSMLDKIGGEIEFDKWNVVYNTQRGVNSGLEIRYGVNMSDLEAETDATELVTACVPYWKGTVNEVDTVVVGDMCSATNASTYAYVRCVPLDVSQQFEETDTQPTKAQVTEKGQAFINSTSRRLLQTSIRVSYEPTTSGIGERRINLCDTVRVVYPDLNVSSISKVVETKFNVLVERYDELTIGTIRNNIVDTIAGLVSGGASYSGGGSSGGGGSSPVTSVNGMVGDVVLNAASVGALPNTYTAPVRSVNGMTGDVVVSGGGSSDFVLLRMDENGYVYNGTTSITGTQINALAATNKAVFMWDEDNERLYTYAQPGLSDGQLDGSAEFVMMRSDGNGCLFEKVDASSNLATFYDCQNLPTVLSSDTGKVLTVNNSGQWVAQTPSTTNVFYYIDGTTVKSAETNLAVTAQDISRNTTSKGVSPIVYQYDSAAYATNEFHYYQWHSGGMVFRTLDGKKQIYISWDSSTATITQEYHAVTLNADGTVNTFDSALTYSAAAASVTNGNPKKLIVTWGNSIFTADADEKLSGANGNVKFITDCEHDGIQRHIIFTLTSANALQTTLIETYARVPITVWEVSDVTQGLIALNANITSSLAWQLTGLNLSPFKRIKVYAKAGRKTGAMSADSSIVPAAIIEMLLDDRAKETVSQNVFIGSAVVQNPNDANRLGMLTCAVSGDKTKFAVVRATSLYGTAATSNTDCYQYVFKIEGYYD